MATGQQERQHNSIRTFALVCVAVTSGYLIWLSWRLVTIISAPQWCNRAIGAAEDLARPEFAVRGCFVLLNKQVDSLSWALLISIGILALCLLVLNVIVLAGGKLSFSANKGGVSANVGRDLPDRALGALQTAQAADEAAQGIAAEEGAADPPASPNQLPDYAR